MDLGHAHAAQDRVLKRENVARHYAVDNVNTGYDG